MYPKYDLIYGTRICRKLFFATGSQTKSGKPPKLPAQQSYHKLFLITSYATLE